MRTISIILVCVFAISFLGCGVKPVPRPTNQVSQQPVEKTAKEFKPFRIERIDSDTGKVAFSLPIPEGMEDSELFLCAVFFTYDGSVWKLSNGYQPIRSGRRESRLWGYMNFPTGDNDPEWYAIRTVATITRDAIEKIMPADCNDFYYRPDEAGVGAYEFIVNINTGENHPVLTLEGE
jgi:hypothetical protein